MDKTWKQMWKDHLQNKYGKAAERWENEKKDDRLVFVTTYRKMQDALDTLDDEPHNLVKSAMASRLQEMQEPMDEILGVFNGR